jgi:glycosyltransferase involved in cell wall biosynthesis
MTQPLVSVIIPVWNGHLGVAECFEAVMKQDYEPLEVIMIDDASVDDSPDKIRLLASGREQVRLITHRENRGLGSTLNEGIAQARGEFVFIVHQDCEVLEPFFISKAVEAMTENPDIGAVTGRRVYEIQNLSPKEKLYMVANGHIAELDHNGYHTQELTFVEDKCDLYRKTVLDAIGAFPASRFRTCGEDQVVSSRIRTSGYRLVRLGNITYRLGFGEKESSLRGILAKLRVYGRTQAGILLTVRGSALSGVSEAPGLFGRAMNRLQMILSSSAMVAGVVLSVLSPYFLLLSLGVFLGRCLTYLAGLERLRGHLKLAVLGPVLDIFYSVGFLEGLAFSSVGKRL